jgi:hypothetical protein
VAEVLVYQSRISIRSPQRESLLGLAERRASSLPKGVLAMRTANLLVGPRPIMRLKGEGGGLT